MKKYIIIALIGGFTIPAFAQEQKRDSLPDMVQLGYQTEMPQKSNCRLHQKRQQQSARQSTRNRYRQSIVRQNSRIKCISKEMAPVPKTFPR